MFVPFRASALLILLVQGFGCLAWWILLMVSPSVRAVFAFGDVPPHVFDGLLLPDVALYAGLALIGAALFWRGSECAYAALMVHFGAAAYATLMAFGLGGASGHGLIGGLLMAVPTAAEGVLVILLATEDARAC